MRGKIELFGLDMQVNMLAATGLRVTSKVKKAALGDLIARFKFGIWGIVYYQEV